MGENIMEITNEHKKSLSMALAIVSDAFTITRYSIPRAGNLNMYNIKSTDGEIDYTINFNQDEDYDEMFRDILLKAVEQYSDTRRVPTLDELDDNGLAIKKVVEVFNSVKNDAVYAEEKDMLDNSMFRLSNDLVSFCNWGENSNYINGEIRTTSDTAAFLDILVDKCLTFGQSASSADIAQAMIESEGNYRLHNMQLASDHAWIVRNKQTTSREDEKKLVKILTYLNMYQDVNTNINTHKQFDNLISLNAMFNNGENHQFVIHDRVQLGEDIDRFSDEMYTAILNHAGYINIEDKTLEQKEGLAFSVIRNAICDPKAFLLGYKRAVEEGAFNFGRDSRVMCAVALNVLAASDNGDNTLKHIEEFSTTDIAKIFDYHYSIATSDPLRAYKKIRNLVNSGDLVMEKKPLTFEDYLKDKYPGLNVVQVSGDDLMDLMDTVSDLFKSMAESEAEENRQDDQDENDEDQIM